MATGSLAIKRSAEEAAKQFQACLRKYENDEKLVILEAVDKPGSVLGDNYTSVMIRTKLVGRRGDGSPYNKSFMTKMLSDERASAGILGLSNLFRNEAHMYQTVLPVLGSFGPECVYYDEKNIIMEDLGQRGYVNCDRRECLDLDHSLLALKTLAKFHAKSLTIKINDPQRFNEMAEPLKEVVYTSSSTNMEPVILLSNKAIVQYLEKIEPRTKEMQGIIDLFTSYADNVYDVFKQMCHAPKKKYDTIVHGDPWVNNLLFRHDKDGKVIDLKMVDYQISRHISVAMDIHYLIYTSMQHSLIEKSYESLIKIYHNAFLGELRRLDVDEKILAELSTEWLESELRAYMLYGPITGCWICNALFADSEDVQQFEKWDPNNLNLFDINHISMSQQKLDRIESITTHYYRRYYLGIINEDIEPIPIEE